MHCVIHIFENKIRETRKNLSRVTYAQKLDKAKNSTSSKIREKTMISTREASH